MDLTELHKTNERAEEQRLRLLIDSVIDHAIYMLDANGFVSTWNKGASRLKGYTEEEILGEHFSKFYTDEDRQASLPQRTLQTAATEGRFEQEGWRVRKDGSRMWAHVVIDPIRNEAGELIGYAKITRDLTEPKAARDALGQSEERFRLLVQGVRDYAIYMLDPGGRVANWNSGARRFKGYAEQEIVGEHFSRFYTDEDRASGLPSRALRMAAEEGKFEQEGWRVRKDGTRFWAHVVIDPIRNDAGELIGYAKVTRDLTERRETQLALERTRAAFIQSQKMEAIGQLSGGIAHDFNNLLAVVLGNLELARKRLPSDSRITRLLDNSIEAAQRGASLTQRMLAFARKQELKSETVDVPALVRGMADLLQRSLGPTIRIDTRFPLQLAAARTDSNQLELALLNLCVNARDAMADNGEVTIAAQQHALGPNNAVALPPGDYLCVSVIDTGEGMDEETLAKAVDPFFTTKGVGKGTGLGLSMIHGFADQGGGRLVLKSRKGEGTTAELWLPAAAQEQPKPSALPYPANDESPAPRTILVVDDDHLVLMNTAAMLEDLGHRVLEAGSGEEALRVFAHQPDIDLLVTDQRMPGMSGTQLARQLLARTESLPVILASGYAEIAADEDLQLLKLRKPFDQHDLARAIVAACHSAGAQRWSA